MKTILVEAAGIITDYLRVETIRARPMQGRCVKPPLHHIIRIIITLSTLTTATIAYANTDTITRSACEGDERYALIDYYNHPSMKNACQEGNPVVGWWTITESIDPFDETKTTLAMNVSQQTADEGYQIQGRRSLRLGCFDEATTKVQIKPPPGFLTFFLLDTEMKVGYRIDGAKPKFREFSTDRGGACLAVRKRGKTIHKRNSKCGFHTVQGV